MAIDTDSKKSSALDHEEVWTAGLPLPTATITQAEMQHSLWSYSEILAAGSGAGTGSIGPLIGVNRLLGG